MTDFQPLPGYPDVHVAASEPHGVVEDGPRQIQVHYRGPAEALIASGAAGAQMLHPPRQDEARTDDDGDEYSAGRLWYQPMSGTARYWRWHVSRIKPLERAVRLPGAAEAWARYEQRREVEEAYRLEELARRPVQRPITDNTWKHGGRSRRITRGRALAIAVEHLTRQLRASLELSEAWLPERAAPTDDEALDHALALLGSPEESLPGVPAEPASGGLPLAGVPDTPYDELALRRSVRKRPDTPQANSPIEPEPKGRPVWRVCMPHDFGRTMMVGSSRLITIDAESGEILSDCEEGE